MLVLLALSVTLVAVLASSGAAGVVSWLRTEAAARRRARARAAELAYLAAAAQRWRLTPAALRGPAAESFNGVSFGALGLATSVLRPAERRTAHGVYRLVHVPAGPVLAAAAARAGVDAGGDGLLVVGHDPVTGDDAAVVVLSPLVQIPLASVPRAWIAELSRRPTPEAAPETAPAVAPRRPLRPAVATDRPAAPSAPPLRLVSWSSPPAPPAAGEDALDRAPPAPRRHRLWRLAA